MAVSYSFISFSVVSLKPKWGSYLALTRDQRIKHWVSQRSFSSKPSTSLNDIGFQQLGRKKKPNLPGRWKSQNVGQERRVEVCEGKSSEFGCKDGGLINVVKALYGRLNRQQCNRHTALYNTNCRSSVSLEKVKAGCQDKSHCVLTASNGVFGDPCRGTYKYLEVTYKCVQPETCGKYPKCHPNAVCVNNDHCECKAPYQGDGIKGCYPVCFCQASGDPHYRMFDGQIVHFMGTCKYTLSRYDKKGDSCSYAVEVDGKHVYLPYKTDQFQIILSGRYVQLETRCGLVVQFDGTHTAKIRVPNVYGNDLTGMCGNCNENSTDDLKDFTQFQVVDDSDRKRCKKEESFHPCAKHPKYRIEGESKSVCRIINPANTAKNPFSRCFTNSNQDAEVIFGSCVYDYCAFRLDNEDGKYLEDVLCDHVSSLAGLCASKGIIVKWRTSTLCPLLCGPNSHYRADMTACPATCVDPEAPKTCPRNPVEGCECDSGYVLSNQRCVREAECGCTDVDGEYYPLGTKFVSSDCSLVKQCKAEGDQMKIVIKERRVPCGTNAECKAKDGEYTCVCKARHTGDPLKGCKEIICRPNAHYVEKVSACPATCENPTAPDSCTKPMTEGCACDKGFVRNEGQCIRVQDCGCRDEDGKRYRDGTEFVSRDCSVVKYCTVIGNQMKIVVKERRGPCGTNAECKANDGKYACVCKARHTGNPRKGCTDLTPTTLKRYPHVLLLVRTLQLQTAVRNP
ncbi:zonadhesin-like [Pecten maximus]|uniref:zonadhesin-like n=1 Tax=Pecten maximus TaxID=6579 RepID=UPI00145869A9|nr:zonadhesin-like [Pecten maximus]